MPVIKKKKSLVIGIILLIILLAIVVSVIHKAMEPKLVLNVEKNSITTKDRQVTEPDYSQTYEDHFLIAQNDKFQMYFEDSGMGIILIDKQTGKILQTTQKVTGNDKNLQSWKDFMASGLSVELLKNGTRQTVRYTMFSKNVTKEITYYKDGFSANVDITISPDKKNKNSEEQHVKLQMNVFLTEEGIDVTVPSESIVDTVGDSVDKLSSLYIYPFMGSTNLDEKKGYMFIPDGSGVLVSLDNNGGRFTTPYTAKIYGKDIGIDGMPSPFTKSYPKITDPEAIYMPLFGIIYSQEQSGVMGLIKNGQESADIIAYPNGVSTEYNWITAQYFLRQSYIHQTSKNSSEGITAYEKNLIGSDIYVSYYFMTENASYARMAEIYRNYLIEKGILTRQDIEYKVGLDVIGAENEDGLLKDRTFAMTTADEAGDMLDYLRTNGVNGMNFIYRGWQKGGYDEKFPIESVRVEQKIGGKSELTDLINKANEMGDVDFSLYDDFGIATKNNIYDTGKDIVKRIDKLIYDDGDYFLTPVKLLELSAATIPEYKAMNVKSLAVSGITKSLYTYLIDDNEINREQTKFEHMEVLRTVSGEMDLFMDAPYDYLWKYAQGIYNMPLSGSNYSYASTEIPFLSMVLKGYIPMYSEYCNLNASPEDYILKLAESGVFPNFIITQEDNTKLMNTSLDYIFTSRFDDFKDIIVKDYSNLKELNEKVSEAVIVDHQILEPDFVCVTYDNGVKVYVNYTGTVKQADNIEVESKSFKVVY